MAIVINDRIRIKTPKMYFQCFISDISDKPDKPAKPEVSPVYLASPIYPKMYTIFTNHQLRGKLIQIINLPKNGKTNPAIPPKAPKTIIYGIVQRTKAFITGERRLNCPKVTKSIGATPI
jgi:hypothetical protein